MPGEKGRRTPESAARSKELLLKLFEGGVTVAAACKEAGVSTKTHEYYMGSDDSYRARVLAIRSGLAKKDKTTTVPEFAEFRREYLGRQTFWHQFQWIDLLEGRDPRDLHPAETYDPGDTSYLIVNTPPEHSKSTTITLDYVIWRLMKDPNMRVVIVSKTHEFAKKWIYQIKTILTHPRYQKLQTVFGPVGGFKADADSWTADRIYFGQATRDSGEKDPTVQALGLRGQIYGSRSDLIILDDVVDTNNAHEFEKQINWLQQDVITRPGSSGRIIVVGTRVAPQDLYSELRNKTRYPDGESPWTYFAQPAVLEYADEPKDWVTLWPRTNEVCGCKSLCRNSKEPGPDGLHPKWDGRHLARRRALIQPATWQRVYMQANIAEDQVFRPECVAASINGQRVCGPLVDGGVGHPEHGMEGHYRIGSMDPAMAGHTAAIVYSVDRTNHRRYVLDVHDQGHMTPLGIRLLIKTWTDKYKLHEWRIEDNAFQSYLSQDQELKDWLASRGCVLNPHRTGRNKWDPDFGVASMAPLFGDVDPDGKVRREPLIELPSTKQIESVKRLVEQLVSWQPTEVRGKQIKTDIVMALWFAEIRAREILTENTYAGTHMPNRYVTPKGRREQLCVNLDDAWLAKQLRRDGVEYFPVPPLKPRLPAPWVN